MWHLFFAALAFPAAAAVTADDLRRKGIEAANSGRLRVALHLFRQAAVFSPRDSRAHNDVCVAAMRLREFELAKRECEKAIDLDDTAGLDSTVARKNLELVKASIGEEIAPPSPPAVAEDELAAFDSVVESAVRRSKGSKGSAAEHEAPSATFPPTSPAGASSSGDRTCPADRAGRARCALELLDDHQQPSAATAALCDSDAAVHVTVDAAAIAAGRLPPDTLLQAKAALRVCGAVVLTRAFSEEHTAALRKEQEALLDEHLASRGLLAKPNTTLTAERSAQRYEVKFSLREHIQRSSGASDGSVFSAATLQSGIVGGVLASTFGLERSVAAALEIDTISHVTSLPGAPSQHWHRDTARMLSNGVLSSAHCLTLFVPTRDVKLKHGPTELLLGSHLACDPRERLPISVPDQAGASWTFEEECPHVVAHRPWKATASAGAAIIVDSRLLHRGGPNRSRRNRPQLYITFARQWFTDRVNFAEAQSKSIDTLSPELQHLLSRIDAREYVELLEEELSVRGVDVKSLRTERSRSYRAS